jgi:hypothetical protein
MIPHTPRRPAPEDDDVWSRAHVFPVWQGPPRWQTWAARALIVAALVCAAMLAAKFTLAANARQVTECWEGCE